MNYKFRSAKEAIPLLLEQRGNACVSIIFPLFHHTPDQQTDWDKLDKLINETIGLTGNLPAETGGLIRNSLRDVWKMVTFNRNDKGLGIYVAAGMSYYMTFPFAVRESILVSDAFQMKELFRLNQFASDKLLLFLSEAKARLFNLLGAVLTEVKDGFFPAVPADNYEYEKPSRANSYSGSAAVKSFEKDRSIVRKQRFGAFLREVDHLLGKYLKPGTGLVVCGTRHNTSEFLQHTRYAANVIGTENGGYDWYDERELSDLIRPSVRKDEEDKLGDLLRTFLNKSGEGFTEQGLAQVWNAVNTGKVDIMLVENNFESKGYVLPSRQDLLWTEKPNTGNPVFYPLVVNELTQQAVLRGGRVVFVEQGMLSEGIRIAAVCRY